MTHSIKPFRQGELKTFLTILCDGYVITGLRSMAELVVVLRETALRHPGMRILATLDDFDQACYTSGHAIHKHGLDDTEGHDLSCVDPDVFENGEHPGFLTTKSEFFIRHGNLKRMADAQALPKDRLYWSGGEDEFDFLALNADPDIVDDSEVCLQIVPVAQAYETVSAFPNGYFSDDLTPMELWALARHFEETYGYELIGIGASYVGFLRTRSLSETELLGLTTDIVSLFRADDSEVSAARVAEIVGQAYFVLNYSGR